MSSTSSILLRIKPKFLISYVSINDFPFHKYRIHVRRMFYVGITTRYIKMEIRKRKRLYKSSGFLAVDLNPTPTPASETFTPCSFCLDCSFTNSP